MVASRFIKIFSIAVIVTFLVSSVEPADCPKAKNTDGKKEKFLVTFNKKSDADKHLEMMKECYDLKVQHVSSIDRKSFKMNSKENTNTILSFTPKSSEGGIPGYSALFTTSFADQVKGMNSVKLVEKEIKVNATYVIPQSLYKREEDDNPTPNDDRIDQAKFPLNGKYVFPDSAGEGVNIFVVDTGIRTTHNEFEDRASFGGSFCDGCNDEDENGHGTHVASIAAGKTLGVARKANVIAVRVLDAEGSGSNVGVIEGLNFVIDAHNKAKNKNSIINMSLGGGFSQAVNDAVAKCTDAGIHVAVAAGNDGEDACKSSPASELSAVTVGATELDSDQVTDFSNIGKCLDIFAPGRDIQGAGIKNDNDGAVFSGTSQATPHVAGTMALIIAEDGNKTPEEMAKELDNLATKGVVEGLKNGDPDRMLRIPKA